MTFLDELARDRADDFRAKRPLSPFQSHTELGATLFDVRAIDDLIEAGTVRHPMITMGRGGYRLRPHTYSWDGELSIPGHEHQLRPALVAQQFAAGSTIIVESLHMIDREIGRVTEELTRDVGTYCTACAFLTPASSQGLTHHFDTHDAFVVQVDGSKRWELFAPPFNQPLEVHNFEGVEAYPGLAERIAGTPDLSFTMHPGDVLFLPRGWIHNVYATDEQSLHLNFAMTIRSRHWVLTKLLDALVDFEWARQEVSAPPLGGKFDEDELCDIGERLAEWICENAGGLGETVGLFFGEGIPERNGRPVERVARLPITASDTLSWQPRMILGSRQHEWGTELVLPGGDSVVLPKPVDDPLMAALREGRPVPVSELIGASNDGLASRVGGDLVLLGVVDVIRP